MLFYVNIHVYTWWYNWLNFVSIVCFKWEVLLLFRFVVQVNEVQVVTR